MRARKDDAGESRRFPIDRVRFVARVFSRLFPVRRTRRPRCEYPAHPARSRLVALSAACRLHSVNRGIRTSSPCAPVAPRPPYPRDADPLEDYYRCARSVTRKSISARPSHPLTKPSKNGVDTGATPSLVCSQVGVNPRPGQGLLDLVPGRSPAIPTTRPARPQLT